MWSLHSVICQKYYVPSDFRLPFTKQPKKSQTPKATIDGDWQKQNRNAILNETACSGFGWDRHRLFNVCVCVLLAHTQDHKKFCQRRIYGENRTKSKCTNRIIPDREYLVVQFCWLLKDMLSDPLLPGLIKDTLLKPVVFFGAMFYFVWKIRWGRRILEE